VRWLSKWPEAPYETKMWSVLLDTTPNSGSRKSLQKPRVPVWLKKRWKVASEFTVPDRSKEVLNEKRLHLVLSNKTKSLLFVSPSAVHSLILKLRDEIFFWCWFYFSKVPVTCSSFNRATYSSNVSHDPGPRCNPNAILNRTNNSRP